MERGEGVFRPFDSRYCSRYCYSTEILLAVCRADVSGVVSFGDDEVKHVDFVLKCLDCVLKCSILY